MKIKCLLPMLVMSQLLSGCIFLVPAWQDYLEEADINFHGVIVDQYENPVPSARMRVDYFKTSKLALVTGLPFDSRSTYETLVANDEGKVSLTWWASGHSFHVNEIAKPGFSYGRQGDNGQRSFYLYGKDLNIDEDKPLKYYLIDLGKAELLYKKSFSCKIEFTKEDAWPPKEKSWTMSTLPNKPKGAVSDLFSISLKGNTFRTDFLLTPVNCEIVMASGSGMIAPETGYGKESIELSHNSRPVHFFCHDLQNDIYMACRLSFSDSRVRGCMYVNPFKGSRNLAHFSLFEYHNWPGVIDPDNPKQVEKWKTHLKREKDSRREWEKKHFRYHER